MLFIAFNHQFATFVAGDNSMNAICRWIIKDEMTTRITTYDENREIKGRQHFRLNIDIFPGIFSSLDIKIG
jgi:hypothetical protein